MDYFIYGSWNIEEKKKGANVLTKHENVPVGAGLAPASERRELCEIPVEAGLAPASECRELCEIPVGAGLASAWLRSGPIPRHTRPELVSLAAWM